MTARRLALVLVLLASGCPEPASSPARPQPVAAWTRSEKLDADLQEHVLRTYDVDLAFAFHVRRTGEDGGIDETTVHARANELEPLVRDPRVVAIRCAPPPTAQIADAAWREKVDPDVRTVYAAHGACWTPVILSFGPEPTEDEWREVEELGVVVHARDARSAIVWVPVRAVPRVAAVAFVARIEPFEQER